MKMTLAAAVVLLAVATHTPLAAQGSTAPSQIAAGSSVQLTAEILSFDPATRAITLKGPFGGVLDAYVSDAVKDISGIKPGAMMNVTYYNAVAASVQRKGESKPLFTAGDVAARAEPGKPARAASTITESFTVHSVDTKANTVILKDKEGTLQVIDVVRPEFRAKLVALRVGDRVDMTYSDAVVNSLTPATPGAQAKLTMSEGTLVIERGEIVKRMNNVLMIRNERGRMIRVTVPTDFIFNLDGKQVPVTELPEGTKLTKAAIRVEKVEYAD